MVQVLVNGEYVQVQMDAGKQDQNNRIDGSGYDWGYGLIDNLGWMGAGGLCLDEDWGWDWVGGLGLGLG